MEYNLSDFRNKIIKDPNSKNVSKICCTIDIENPHINGVAGSGIWSYNPTIKDYSGRNPKTFCNTSDDYVQYYKSLLTDDYIDGLPENFFKGKNKESIKEEMSKLRTEINKAKKMASDNKKFNEFGKSSFEPGWHIENCAEIWSKY